MNGLEKVYKFIDEVHNYCLATVEDDQPRVRVFGTALLYENKLYIQTGKKKNVSKQLAKNPKAELCAWKGLNWLRVSGELVNDDNRDVKVKMIEKMPALEKIGYNADDDNMQMLYFKNATATFSSISGENEVIKL